MLVRVLGFLLLLATGITIAYFMIRPSDELPVYRPIDLNPLLVDSTLRRSGAEHRLLDFQLTDQLGRTVTLADTRGRVVLADFFFTTCGSICPKMTTQMERVQAAYKDEPRLLLLSHSVTPEVDSVPVLKAYADLHNACSPVTAARSTCWPAGAGSP